MVFLANNAVTTDHRLLMLMVQQDPEALGALYDRYAGSIYRFAVSRLGDQGAAEEVTQDVFFNVWRRAHTYEAQRGSAKTWLFSIAHHRIVDELRAKRRKKRQQVDYGIDLTERLPDDSTDPSEYAITHSEYSLVRTAVGILRAKDREVVSLAFFGELSHREIANYLGHPMGTVKTRIRRGLKTLQDILGPRITSPSDNALS